MGLPKGMGDFFAIDIGTTAVRVVQLSRGPNETWNLKNYGYAPVDDKTSTSDSTESIRKLGEIIMTAVGQSGIKSKNVVVGMSSSKTFTTIIDVPNMTPIELKNTIKYQTEQYIPMTADEAKVDWAALGQSLHDPKQQEVLIASTTNTYSEERLEFIENLGFNVIAIEPDPIAMIRALLPVGIKDARMIIDVGENSTDLAITFNDSPRLVRTIPMGLRSLVRVSAQNLNVQDEQARQFILKFGLAQDKLEGQVYRAIESTLDNFAAELVKSVKFFQTRYPNIAVGGILLSGFSAVLPQFGEYITAKTSIPTALANPWQRVNVLPADQQKLSAIAYEFATVIGLAERSNL